MLFAPVEIYNVDVQITTEASMRCPCCSGNLSYCESTGLRVCLRVGIEGLI